MRAKNIIKLSIEVPEDLTDFFLPSPHFLILRAESEKGRESMMPLSIMGKALSGVLLLQSDPPSLPRNEEQGDDSDSD